MSFALRNNTTLIQGGRAVNSVAPIAPQTISLGADLIVSITGATGTINLYNDGDDANVTSIGGRLAAQLSIMKLSD